MLLILFMEYIAFPSREDAILTNEINSNHQVQIDVSGSLGIWRDGKCQKTSPNSTLTTDKKTDWCSNIGQTKEYPGKPWITFSLKNKVMQVKEYAIRNGCCWYGCCCYEDGTEIRDVYCCCRLYSFSLYGSNDNHTWKHIHSVEKDAMFRICEFKTYDLKETYTFKFYKFELDEPFQGCPLCLQINQIEFYGKAIQSLDTYEFEGDDIEEESVSIIGKINKNTQY